MSRLALALTCVLGLSTCAHPEPRGPVATTPARPGAPAPVGEGAQCSEAKAPHLAELCAMGEPALSVAGPETYRFIWLRHLNNPVVVRVSKSSAGVTVVAVESDVHDPKDRRRHEFTTGLEFWKTLRGHLDAADFWNMPGDPDDEEGCLDCADWIVEGRRGGVYHSVIRHNPKPGPFRTVCEDIGAVSGLAFPGEIR
jgi:hypothetical protein